MEMYDYASEVGGGELEGVDAWVGFGGIDTWLSTYFPDRNIWTTLHWFIVSSW